MWRGRSLEVVVLCGAVGRDAVHGLSGVGEFHEDGGLGVSAFGDGWEGGLAGRGASTEPRVPGLVGRRVVWNHQLLKREGLRNKATNAT